MMAIQKIFAKIGSKYSRIFILILVIFAKGTVAQDDIIRVDTNLVAVPVTVLDHDGRYVTNLKKEDFQIFEDGVEQEIALFEPIEQQFTVFLLLDVSGSMVFDMNDLANAANTFVGQLRPNDNIIAATFAEQTEVIFKSMSVNDFRNKKKFRLKVIGLPPVTMVYDAVEFALKKVKKIQGRKAIILLSDGIGSGFSASAKSNFRDAEEGESLIYTISFDTNINSQSRYESKKQFEKRLEQAEFARNYMRDLAQKTGGRNFQIENVSNLEQTFGEVANELGRQYSLGYYPKSSITGRKQIKVKIRQPNLIVRARSSYVVEKK